MDIKRSSAGFFLVSHHHLIPPGKNSLEEESASHGGAGGGLYIKYGQKCAWGMVREEFNLKLRNIDGKKKQNQTKFFPLVALQCMPTLQLPADENPGLLFY